LEDPHEYLQKWRPPELFLNPFPPPPRRIFIDLGPEAEKARIPIRDPGYWGPNTQLEWVSQFYTGNYDAENSYAAYWGYKATWVWFWGTAIRLNNKDFSGAGLSFIDDVLTVVTLEQLWKAGISILTPFNNGGVLKNARFAQTSYANTFSPEGIRFYSRLAGRPINTIDDLVAAIQAGHINPSKIPVNYIVRPGGRTLILNTRTSQALERAGIPRWQWNAQNVTGNDFFEKSLSIQLRNNNLTNRGIGNPVWNGR
jgi:hypothetical protein